MPALRVHQEKITPEIAASLVALCPFSAIRSEDGRLLIDSGCKMCKICVTKGQAGAITLEEEPPAPAVDKAAWRGIAVWAEYSDGALHNVTRELLGKARELAAVTGHPVLALLAGTDLAAPAAELLRCGADKVYCYDDKALTPFRMEPYANVFADFIERARPSSVLVGATVTGRALAPRVAARFRTGLTADCTVLEMNENTDLVQIRPAFGGNIMARILTPNHRPQFCTARYKVFTALPPLREPTGVIERVTLPPERLASTVEILSAQPKPKQVDISDARAIVAVGRGVKRREGLLLAERLAESLGAQTACTRPLIENGWFDPRRQIGLSGRTVGAELIVTLGISGSVQFAAGMRGCGCIVAINTDENAPIFDLAHYALVGDLYEIVPELLAQCGRAI